MRKNEDTQIPDSFPDPDPFSSFIFSPPFFL